MHILSDQEQFNPLVQFRQAASLRMLVLPKELRADGKIHRCPLVGKADNDGAYLIRLDGYPSGGFQNHTDGLMWENWHADLGRPVTAQEQAAYQKQIEASRVAWEADDLRIKAAAAIRAKQIWEAATPCETHGYLTKKGVRSHGLREKGGDLLVPLYTPAGVLTSIQTITPSGAKLFLTGGRKSGCHFMLGAVGGGPIYIAEGYATGATIQEATGQAVAIAFDAGNLTSVAEGLRLLHPDVDLVLCADDDRTEGNPGLTHATAAAQVVHGRFVVPDWGSTRPDGATDFNDMAQHFGKEAVKACLEGQSVSPEPESLPNAVRRLAVMDSLEYELLRTKEAANFGIRVGALDDAVDAARSSQEGSAKTLKFPDVDLWPLPVNAAVLLDEIRATFHRFIIADPSTGVAIALWITFTWLIGWFKVAPLLVLSSPEKRCGKTQTLYFVSQLSCRALVASNISPAAVFRVIEAHSPTLIIDEADSFLKENEEIRGVLNSGHTRQTAFVIRCVGDDQEPRQFSTWAAKAIAGIGHLASTLTDRAIEARLRRKLPSESCERLRHADPEIFSRLVSKLARLAKDSGPAIGADRPTLPEKLNDRAQDNWEPLLAIADHAKGEWPELARAAALILSGDENATASTSTELLSDIKDLLVPKNVTKIHTANLLTALITDETKAWANYSYGKPISARQLGRLLNEFGVHSTDIKIDKVNRKGYVLADFTDAFARYLISPSTPPKDPQPATSEHSQDSSGSGGVAVAEGSATQEEAVADPSATSSPSATPKSVPTQESSGVADPTWVSADKHTKPGSGGQAGRPF